VVCSVKTWKNVPEWVTCNLILGCCITGTLLSLMYLAILISAWIDEKKIIHTLWFILYVLLAQSSKILVLNWILDIAGSLLAVFQWIEIIEFHSNMIHGMSLHSTMTIQLYIIFCNNSSFISFLVLTVVCSVKTWIVLEWVCCDLILGWYINGTLLPGMQLAILISAWIDEKKIIPSLVAIICFIGTSKQNSGFELNFGHYR